MSGTDNNLSLSRRHLLVAGAAAATLSPAAMAVEPAKEFDLFCPSELAERALRGGFCFMRERGGEVTVYVSQRHVHERFADASLAVAEMMKTDTRRDVMRAYFADTDKHHGKRFVEVHGAPFEAVNGGFTQVDRLTLERCRYA